MLENTGNPIIDRMNIEMDRFFELQSTSKEQALADASPSDFISLFQEYFSILYDDLTEASFYKDLPLVYQPMALMVFLNKMSLRLSSRIFYYFDGVQLSSQYPQLVPNNTITKDEALLLLSELKEEDEEKSYYDTFINPDVLFE